MDYAVAESLHTYIKSLRRYAIAITQDPNDADDLVQECLKRALSYIYDGRKIRDLRAYLFTILHNVHSDNISRKMRNGTHLPIDNDGIRLVYPAPQHAYMDCRDLFQALERLPAEQRKVVLLVGMEGMSYQAAADTLGIPVGTVMSRLSRGRNALRRMLSAEAPGERRRGADGESDDAWRRQGGKVNVG